MLFFVLMASVAFAEEIFFPPYTCEVLNDNGDLKIISIYKDSVVGDVIVPNKILGYNVTAIGKAVFADSAKVYSVAIPKTIETIEADAFKNCSMQELELSEGLETIQKGAFENCKNLSSVVIPSSVKNIDGAFCGCEKLLQVKMDDALFARMDEKKMDSTFNGTLYLSKVLFDKFVAKLSSPEVTKIDDSAFTNFDVLTTFEVPDNITEIGNNAFENCKNLVSVTIGKNVKTIGDGAFSGCTSLKTITFNENIERVGNSAFAYCVSLENIILPDSLEVLGESAFSGDTKLSSVVFGKGIERILNSTFSQCSALQGITIPENIKTIDNNAFAYCDSLKTVSFAGGLDGLNIGDTAFVGVPLDDKVIADLREASNARKLATMNDFLKRHGGTSIKFNVCNKSSDFICDINDDGTGVVIKGMKKASYKDGYVVVIIPDTVDGFPVKEIDGSAFMFIDNLIGVFIYNGVEKIGYKAFTFCHNLMYAELSNNVRVIDSETFENCENLLEIQLPNRLVKIGSSAFEGCAHLSGVNFPFTLEEIGSSAFKNSGFVYFVSPKNLKIIGDFAFSNSLVSTVNLISPLERLGTEAFESCKNLKSVSIIDCAPNALHARDPSDTNSWHYGEEYFCYAQFLDCTKLESVYLDDKITDIGNGCFFGCKSLSKVRFPDAISYIGNGAFKNCSALSEVFFADSVSVIEFNNMRDDNATAGQTFVGCTSLDLKQKARIKKLGYSGSF